MGPETDIVSEGSLANTGNGGGAATGTGRERAPHEQKVRTSDSRSHCIAGVVYKDSACKWLRKEGITEMTDGQLRVQNDSIFRIMDIRQR